MISNDLNTTEFIEKNREDEKRFNSLDAIQKLSCSFGLKMSL